MVSSLHRHHSTPIPQTRPIPGRGMVPNSAGGYGFTIDRWARLDRFLILGTDGGTYYATEPDHTADNVAVVRACLDADGPATIARVVDVATRGVAPRPTPALYALAAGSCHPDPATRAAANDAVARVCRTGTHLFTYAEFQRVIGGAGWGRSRRRSYARVLEGRPVDRLALHAIKYRQRGGWTWRDVCRLSHPSTGDPARNAVFRYMVTGEITGDAPPILAAAARAQAAGTAAEVAALVVDHRLPWEAIPGEFVNDPAVLAAVVDGMPVTATVRQLARFARAGMLTPMGSTERAVVARLTDPAQIAGSRAHPLLFLDAMAAHASGGAVGRSRGAGYTPNRAVVDALDEAFRLAFGNVEPSGRRTYIGLDVSGSMGCGTAGSSVLTARDASTALALVTAAVEPVCHIAAFSDRMVPIGFGPRSSVADAVRSTTRIPFGRTDCAMPMLDALARRVEVDTFVIYTDTETYAGVVHPVQALEAYRSEMVPDARLVVVAMTSTGFSIADPADPGMLDVVGFSGDLPQVIAGFSRREF